VIDLYPAQANGGYFFDVTRTYASAALEESSVYALVAEAVNAPSRACAGRPARVPGEGLRPVRAPRA
jgi:hypothetical protein